MGVFESYIIQFPEDSIFYIVGQIIVILVQVFGYSVLIVGSLIVFSRWRINSNQNKLKKWREYYSKLLIRFLINDFSQEEYENLGKLKDRFERNVLIDVLISIDAADNEIVSRKIRELYFKLGLHKDSIRKLYSRAWEKKIKGLRELTHMDIKTENEIIFKYAQSKNPILRSESQMALVKLIPNDPFTFLEKQVKVFTVWEQINVFDMIRKRRINIPNFAFWLNHWNDSVVMFALDMIRILKQKHSYKQVVGLIDHQNERLRAKVIKTLIEIRSNYAGEVLKKVYPEEEKIIKINIIRSLGWLKQPSDIKFFEQIISDEDDIDLKLEACLSLNRIEGLGKIRLKKLSEDTKDDTKNLISDVLYEYN
ncbi:MAG: HEAT repeat domain-containing protein [Marinifilaceae bacterium]|jgi:hypothetical protein|nr:HEAT repeat domain-containing protein [Marinifilaceae bacterium]